MVKRLFLILGVIFLSFLMFKGISYFFLHHEQAQKTVNKNTHLVKSLMPILNMRHDYKICPKLSIQPLDKIKEVLHKEGVSAEVINKALTILTCSNEKRIENSHTLTIIDYSLPASEKRLWVFDLAKNKLLFHTYVSHGLKSGALFSQYFSNKFNDKTSSIGVYNTEQAYRGRHGASLRLNGLDNGFNDNAYRRAVVMHGGWYVEGDFIKKYGRAGRSWGCPAVPLSLVKPIIDTIKDNALMVIYYPNKDWFLKSHFLNCAHNSSVQSLNNLGISMQLPQEENKARGEILFVDINNDGKRQENEPIIAITADNYQRVFGVKAPLNRMLRRQINKTEYIALNYKEFEKLNAQEGLKSICFVTAVVKMERGYYATEMKIVNLGNIKQVKPNLVSSYIIYFQTRPSVHLRSTDRFIRWLGL